MIKYEVQVVMECDSWEGYDDYHYEVHLFNNHVDNGLLLQSFGSTPESLVDARAFAYDVYNVMDPSETKYVDQTR